MAGTSVTATLNGQPKKAGFIVPPNADPKTQLVLKVENLGLSESQADGAEVCITLDGSCETLKDLCKEGDGTCKVAITSADHLCCPVSIVGYRCPVCINWEIREPEDPEYTLGKDDCDRFTQLLHEGDIHANNMGPVISEGRVSCTATKLSYCGYLNEEGLPEEHDTVDEHVEEYLDELYKYMLPFCPVWATGYTYSASMTATDGSQCVDAEYTEQCSLDTPNFPFCECVKRSGASPFALEPVVSEDGTTYCFAVSTVDPDNEGTCGSATTLKKVEFYASQDLKWEIAAISVKTKKGSSKPSVSWGSESGGDYNTLKVTNLGWSDADVDTLQPQICIELKAGTTLKDLCMASDVCWASLFDPSQNCCPVYPAGLE